MSNLQKIFISLLIMIIISVTSYFILFKTPIDVEAVKFINSNLELKYDREMRYLKENFDRVLDKSDKSIESYIKEFNFAKFSEKSNDPINITQENQLSEKLLSAEKDLVKIKFINNRRELLYTTDDKEKLNYNKQSKLFISGDDLEKKENLFDLSAKEGDVFLQDNYFILRKNALAGNKNIGVICFYYSLSRFNDMLRNLDYFDFKNITPAGTKYLLINKPDYLDAAFINDKDLGKDKKEIKLTVKDENSGKETASIYRLFYSPLDKYGLTLLGAYDSELFKLDKKRSMVLIYILFFSVYILILMIILFRKSELSRARERMSLFTAALLEELINAGSRDELQSIKDSLRSKKDSILNTIYGNYKKLKDKDKKNLEDELSTVFDKIDMGFKKRYPDEHESGNINRIEALFEKFIEKISEKGINIVQPELNISGGISSIPPKKVAPGNNSDDKLEEVDEIEELSDETEQEAVDEIEELSDETEQEAVDEIEENAEVEDIGAEAGDTESAEIIEEVADEELEEIGESEDTEDEGNTEITETEEVSEADDEPDTLFYEPQAEFDDAEDIAEIEELDEITDEEPLIDESSTAPADDRRITSQDEIIELNEFELQIDKEIEKLNSIKENDTTEPDNQEDINIEFTISGLDEEIPPDADAARIEEEIDGLETDLEILETEENLEVLEEEIEEITSTKTDEDTTEPDNINGENSSEFIDKIEHLENIIDGDLSGVTYIPNIASETMDLYLIGDEDEETKHKTDDIEIDNPSPETTLDDFPEITMDFDDVPFYENEEVPENTAETEYAEEFMEDLDELEDINDEIPTVPEQFYMESADKNDPLSRGIQELSDEKTDLQLILHLIYDKIGADKLSLMVGLTKYDGFMQTYQIGYDNISVEKFILKTDNPIVEHIYKVERMVFVSDIERVKSMFANKDFDTEFGDIKSLIIYPVKLLGKVRALLFMGFYKNNDTALDSFISLLNENEVREGINKGVLKIL